MSVRLVALYAAFAAVAIAANIGSQWLVIRGYGGPASVAVSMLVGTATGLVVKYVLDKRWIFRFRADGRLHEARTFALYTVMGLTTTAIFWGVELGFHWAFGTELMRYVGGVIGLVIGYWIKYLLDAKYVFAKR